MRPHPSDLAGPQAGGALFAQAHSSTRTPWEWEAEDWARLERQRQPIFDEAAISQLDREAFLRDGVLVLDGAMTAHGRREWTAALQAGQRTRDAFIRCDWRAAVDWQSLYRAPPTAQPSAAQIAASSGCMQSPPGDESCGTITLKNHGLFVDHFSAGHLPFLMDVLTHPQMLQLQRTLLGCSHVLLDHNSLLSRKAGYEGGAWHSHSMNSQNWNPMGPMDGGTPCSPQEYDAQPNFILNLVYPGELQERFGSDPSSRGIVHFTGQNTHVAVALRRGLRG